MIELYPAYRLNETHPPDERVKSTGSLDSWGHGMLILLPSDVQGRGNALIISSRVPLKEKPSGGFWWGVVDGWLVGVPRRAGCCGGGKRHSTASGSDRDGAGCVCLTPLNSAK